MITKNKNKKTGMGRFMVLPVIAIFICLFSFKLQNSLSRYAPPTIRVVIDPGHGGVFNGTTFNGIYEKNLTLSISKKIQALSKDYHVEVFMTRETDEDVAGNNLDESLNYRTSLASIKNADLFISIHVNATVKKGPQNEHSGFEIYVPDNSSKFHTGSVKLASTITEYIKPDYTIESELKERVHTIRVLDQATVPAIMIHCGYIDNLSDMSWMQDPKNQEKIARDILEGIQKYGEHMTAYSSVPHENATVTENVVATEHVVAKSPQSKEAKQEKEIKQNKEIQQANELAEANEFQQVAEVQQVHAHDSSSPSRKVEIEAEFPGGNAAWREYLIKKVVYPPAAVSNELQGEVLVEFVVSTSGKVSGVRAISGPQELRAESIRAIKESGKWIPAKDQGKKVVSYKTQPIDFKLETK